jgi:hypothetical protein
MNHIRNKIITNTTYVHILKHLKTKYLPLICVFDKPSAKGNSKKIITSIC